MTRPDLAATAFLDFESPAVAEFVSTAVPDSARTPTERAVALFYAVRDRIGYEVYGSDLSREGLRASRVVRTQSGMCLHKSVLYAAGLRSLGVPAKLALADVRNHLASARLRHLMGGDVFRHHCYNVVELDGRRLRVAAVFGRTLCRLYRIAPLEFDGSGDSLFHPYDLTGRRHMEFLRHHGEFDDVPYDRIIRDLHAAHPRLFGSGTSFADGSLVADAVEAR